MMMKRSYQGSTSIRNDVTLVFRPGVIEVWANDDGQFGIVEMFTNGRAASRFIWKNYRL